MEIQGMSGERNELNFVKEMVHVVCLPFRICRSNKNNKAHQSLKEISKFIQKESKTNGGHWRESDPEKRYIWHVNEMWHERHRYQAHAYFHPFVRRFLFESSKGPKDSYQYTCRYRRSDIDSIKVEFKEHPFIERRIQL